MENAAPLTHGKRTGAPAPGRGSPGGFRGLLAVIGIYLLLVVLGIQLGHWITAQLHFDIHHSPETDALWHGVVLVAFVIYVVLMTLPFVPGVEVGMALLLVFGAEMALLVYLGTVLALTLSFAIGRLIPERVMLRAFQRLRLRRAHGLVSRLESLPTGDRLQFLMDATPVRGLGWLIRFRLVALAILFNVPGNALLGGGGGIAMAAGMSRLYDFPGYLLTVCVAAAPVPLLVAITDVGRL